MGNKWWPPEVWSWSLQFGLRYGLPHITLCEACRLVNFSDFAYLYNERRHFVFPNKISPFSTKLFSCVLWILPYHIMYLSLCLWCFQVWQGCPLCQHPLVLICIFTPWISLCVSMVSKGFISIGVRKINYLTNHVHCLFCDYKQCRFCTGSF